MFQILIGHLIIVIYLGQLEIRIIRNLLLIICFQNLICLVSESV